MPISDARKKANAKWNAENLEKIQFYAPKGYNEKINKKAKEKGMSKARYLKKLIDDDMKDGESE